MNYGSYTRHDFASELSLRLNITTAKALRIVDATLQTLGSAMATHERMEFRNFGVFEVKVAPPKIGRNPMKPAEGQYQIPARRRIRFRPGKTLEEKLNPE